MANKKKCLYRLPNIEFSRAMHEIARSSRASRHVPKPKKGTRGANKAKAIREFS